MYNDLPQYSACLRHLSNMPSQPVNKFKILQLQQESLYERYMSKNTFD